ncbi:hypothetical protein LZ31DRAFT_355335 [Colletotrichum somersetense]|nr:hypothetical protein LZ31DRAFT_355335 [Colletotrichum somersetense]
MFLDDCRVRCPCGRERLTGNKMTDPKSGRKYRGNWQTIPIRVNILLAFGIAVSSQPGRGALFGRWGRPGSASPHPGICYLGTYPTKGGLSTLGPVAKYAHAVSGQESKDDKEQGYDVGRDRRGCDGQQISRPNSSNPLCLNTAILELGPVGGGFAALISRLRVLEDQMA